MGIHSKSFTQIGIFMPFWGKFGANINYSQDLTPNNTSSKQAIQVHHRSKWSNMPSVRSSSRVQLPDLCLVTHCGEAVTFCIHQHFQMVVLCSYDA